MSQPALTHRQVDARAGLPIGSTSNYFRTKAALLKGAIALNELVTSSRRGGAERYGLCEQLVAESAVLDMSPKFQGEIEKALGKMGDEARALYKQLVLNGRLEPAAPRSRPRM